MSKWRGARPSTVSRATLWLPLAFIALLASFGFLATIRSTGGLFWAFAAASATLGTWWAILFRGARRRSLKVEISLRPQHYLQALAHVSIFVYWGVYWLPLRTAAPLIAAQIVFAYAFDMLLSWSRRDTYTLGFGPFPVIFSTNLFLRFHDEWFIWQFVMVAAGFAAKELIRWNRNGRQVHIFNPSSFPLALASLLLILTNTSDLTWAEPIATQLFLPPHIYIFIFLVALPGQFLFGVTTMTLSAVLTTYGLAAAYFAATGTYFFVDSNIPIAVFLGMHLLFTDPSTSPRSELGRIVFGVMYGSSVVGLYWLLSWLGAPTYYDKLLQVPIMNLMVRGIDRAAASSSLAWLDPARLAAALRPQWRRLGYTSLWVLVFSAMTASKGLGDDHPGHDVRFWQQACAEGRHNGCAVFGRVLTVFCGQGSAWSCNELGMIKVEKRLQNNLNPEEAFQRACSGGFSLGCRNRMQLAQGNPRHGDPVAADYRILLSTGKGFLLGVPEVVLVESACNKGWSAGCGLLGLMHVADATGSLDKTKGIPYLLRACEERHASSCANLGFAYRQGDGVTPNPVKALEFLKRACDFGMPEACPWLESESGKPPQ